MEHVPPVGWADVATRHDLDHLEVVLRHDIDALRGDMEVMRHELTAVIADRVNAAIASQTRAILFSMVAYFAGVVALALTR